MEAAFGITVGLLLVVLFVWVERASARAREKEQRELQEEIKGLPVDVQVRILSAHLRIEAGRDLF